MIDVVIKNKKIVKTGKSHYFPIKKVYVDAGLIDVKKRYTATFKEEKRK